MHHSATTEDGELTRFVREAEDHLGHRQKRIHEVLREHDKWSLDHGRGLLTLRARRLPLLSTRVVLVGHYYEDTSIFRWGWADESAPRSVVAELEDVRAVGESRGFSKLVRPEWKGSAADAWNMAWISALVLDGRGAHRVVDQGRQTFYVLLDPLMFDSIAPPAACGEW